MSEIADYAAGRPCELHDIPFCADCRKRLGLRRGDAKAGEDRTAYYGVNDCAVQSFRELTGATYAEALEALEGSYRKSGTRIDGLIRALESVGYEVRKAGLGTVARRGARTSGLTLPEACAASADGRRMFLLVGNDSRGAHAWTITEGGQKRAYLRAPYRYGIFEIVA